MTKYAICIQAKRTITGEYEVAYKRQESYVITGFLVLKHACKLWAV